ncbi:MAG: hypothetical protein ABII22_01195 [Candidatus Micrarchaeota archaeon]
MKKKKSQVQELNLPTPLSGVLLNHCRRTHSRSANLASDSWQALNDQFKQTANLALNCCFIR